MVTTNFLSSLISNKKLPFIHFHPKIRNPTASLFRGLQPPFPHMRAHGKTCKNSMLFKTCKQNNVHDALHNFGILVLVVF